MFFKNAFTSNYLDNVLAEHTNNQETEEIGMASLDQIMGLITAEFHKLNLELQEFKQDILNNVDLRLSSVACDR